MTKPTDLTPKFFLISKEEEIIIPEASSFSDFVGQQNINQPTVVQQNFLKSANFLTGVSGWQINADGDVEFNEGVFRGTVSVGSLNIPDETTTASFHVKTDGTMFGGANVADEANALWNISPAGLATFKNIKVGGTTKQYSLGDDGIFSFGDGSDGALTTTGDVTLTSDKYYTNLTISTGDTFYPAGYRIFVNGTLTLEGTAKISRNGVAGSVGNNATNRDGATGGAGGTALADGYLKGSVAGYIGGTGGSGTPSTKIGGNGDANDTSNSIGSDGILGAGGGDGGGSVSVGGGTGGDGGIGGIATTSNVKLIANWHLQTLLDIGSTGATVKYDNSAGAGSGGGGGGGGERFANDGGGGGGGGGSASSGGIIAIYAKVIIIGANASIEANGANGGNGGNGYQGNNNSGGGGGGGAGTGGNGGQIILVYNELTNSGSITVSAGTGGTGGTGGLGDGTGGDGSDGSNGNTGSAGTIRQFQLSI